MASQSRRRRCPKEARGTVTMKFWARFACARVQGKPEPGIAHGRLPGGRLDASGRGRATETKKARECLQVESPGPEPAPWAQAFIAAQPLAQGTHPPTTRAAQNLQLLTGTLKSFFFKVTGERRRGPHRLRCTSLQGAPFLHLILQLTLRLGPEGRGHCGFLLLLRTLE